VLAVRSDFHWVE
jgi:hypothetical protein